MAAAFAFVQGQLQAVLSTPQAKSFLAAVAPAKLGDLQAVLADPTTLTCAVTIVLCISVWLGQVITKYWSWVDRLWVS